MKLNWTDKEAFYHEVAQYTRAGIGLSDALQSMLEGMRGGRLRRFTAGLAAAAQDGLSVRDVFQSQSDSFEEMELATMEAGGESGHLEESFRYLSEFFATVNRARREVMQRISYPIFLAHFAVIVFNIKTLLPNPLTGAQGSLRDFGTGVAVSFVILYLLVGGLYFFWRGLVDIARRSVVIDRVMRKLPLIGGVRRFGSIARFCMTMYMQVSAGVPLKEALNVAGRSARSALLEKASKEAIPLIDSGATLSASLATTPGAIPPDVLRALRLGQEAGSLDLELKRWADLYQEKTVGRIKTLSDWLPRLIYLAVAAYVGYTVITFYSAYLNNINEMLGG